MLSLRPIDLNQIMLAEEAEREKREIALRIMRRLWFESAFLFALTTKFAERAKDLTPLLAKEGRGTIALSASFGVDFWR